MHAGRDTVRAPGSAGKANEASLSDDRGATEVRTPSMEPGRTAKHRLESRPRGGVPGVERERSPVGGHRGTGTAEPPLRLAEGDPAERVARLGVHRLGG